MNAMKRFYALVLALAMTFAMTATAFAAEADTGFSDVAANAWYADAVEYVRDNSLMGGTTETTFAPDATMTRAMLATVLYRAAGSPAVTGDPAFTDTAADAYYSDAVVWASANGIVGGYGNGLFGVNNAITREQIAAILWRYAGSPAPAGTGTAFADQSSIAAYAVSAVAWARENGVINGRADGRFDPKASATRAQVAVILTNYLTDAQSAPAPTPTPETGSRVLVAYFSNTGNTEAVADHLVDVLDADRYEILAATPYTSADLNYNVSDSRANREQNDPAARPAISGSVENMADYDVVFLGYPIWWGQAPKIVSTFLESYDFAGKTIVPFCTSGSSGIGSSATNLHALAPDATWLSGQRFGSNASRSTVETWVNGLDLTA